MRDINDIEKGKLWSHNQAYKTGFRNGLALAGFLASFFVPFLINR